VAVGTGAFADTRTRTPTGSSYGGSGQTQDGVPPGNRAGGRDRRGGHHGYFRGAGGDRGDLGGAVLHGEVVVTDPDGSGTRQMLVQVGEVTAVQGARVTVRSSDGFTVTWTVTGDTRTRSPGRSHADATGGSGTATGEVPVAVGDTVHVAGTRTDKGTGTATALRAEADRSGASGSRRGPGKAPGSGPTDANGATPSTGSSLSS
jgi:hypothetical protein